MPAPPKRPQMAAVGTRLEDPSLEPLNLLLPSCLFPLIPRIPPGPSSAGRGRISAEQETRLGDSWTLCRDPSRAFLPLGPKKTDARGARTPASHRASWDGDRMKTEQLGELGCPGGRPSRVPLAARRAPALPGLTLLPSGSAVPTPAPHVSPSCPGPPARGICVCEGGAATSPRPRPSPGPRPPPGPPASLRLLSQVPRPLVYFVVTAVFTSCVA